MRSVYDPFNRDEEREIEQIEAQREDHQLWSLQQSLKGQSADRRENVGVWLKPALPPEASADSPRS